MKTELTQLGKIVGAKLKQGWAEISSNPSLHCESWKKEKMIREQCREKASFVRIPSNKIMNPSRAKVLVGTISISENGIEVLEAFLTAGFTANHLGFAVRLTEQTLDIERETGLMTRTMAGGVISQNPLLIGGMLVESFDSDRVMEFRVQPETALEKMLTELGLPESEAVYFGKAVMHDHFLLAVLPMERSGIANAIFLRCGVDIGPRRIEEGESVPGSFPTSSTS